MNPQRFVASLEGAEEVAAYIAAGEAHDVVRAVLDGRHVLMAFELDVSEHTRRIEQSVGPVRSRGLLHALWSLPEDLAWPESGLDRIDAETLRREGKGFVAVTRGSVTRVYRPAGGVRAVGLAGRRLVDVVGAACQFPPIFRRYAIATRTGRSDVEAIKMAQAVGVGAAVTCSERLRVVARADAARAGVPSVYRWWLAEVAYRAWLQTNAH